MSPSLQEVLIPADVSSDSDLRLFFLSEELQTDVTAKTLMSFLLYTFKMIFFKLILEFSANQSNLQFYFKEMVHLISSPVVIFSRRESKYIRFGRENTGN